MLWPAFNIGHFLLPLSAWKSKCLDKNLKQSFREAQVKYLCVVLTIHRLKRLGKLVYRRFHKQQLWPSYPGTKYHHFYLIRMVVKMVVFCPWITYHHFYLIRMIIMTEVNFYHMLEFWEKFYEADTIVISILEIKKLGCRKAYLGSCTWGHNAACYLTMPLTSMHAAFLPHKKTIPSISFSAPVMTTHLPEHKLCDTSYIVAYALKEDRPVFNAEPVSKSAKSSDMSKWVKNHVYLRPAFFAISILDVFPTSVFAAKLFFFFFFLWRHLGRMEVPRLVVKSELHLPAYSTAMASPDVSHVCKLLHSLGQCQILNPLSRDRDGTCVLTILVRFISTESQWEFLIQSFSPPKWLTVRQLCS